MKLICFLLGIMLAVSSACADDITTMISQYRREHGLPAVKTDARLTAVALRQAQAMASSGIMDHDVAGSFASRIAGPLRRLDFFAQHRGPLVPAEQPALMERHDNRKRLRLPRLAKYRAFGIARKAWHGLHRLPSRRRIDRAHCGHG